MIETSALASLGWLVFAFGTGLILVALWRSKSRSKSPTRRVAGALNGAVFCLFGLIVMIPDASGTTQKALAIGAVVSGALSWYLGRHSRKVDRAFKGH